MTLPKFPLPTLSEFDFEEVDSKFRSLSDRRFAVLAWLAVGKTNPEIAAIAGISLATVERDITQIFSTLKVENRFAAGALFHQWQCRASAKNPSNF